MPLEEIDYYYDIYYDSPIPRRPEVLNFDGERIWVTLANDEKEPGEYIAWLPVYASYGSNRSRPAFVYNVKDEDRLSAGRRIYVEVSNKVDKYGEVQRDKGGNGFPMYIAKPVRDHEEETELWLPVPEHEDKFMHVVCTIDWKGDPVEIREPAIAVRSRIYYRVDGRGSEIDWDKWTISHYAASARVTKLVQDKTGRWVLTPEQSSCLYGEHRITKVVFEGNHWPFEDLCPQSDDCSQVCLHVASEDGCYVFKPTWSSLPRKVQSYLMDRYPICSGCGSVRHLREELGSRPHCERPYQPASEASLQALAARFGGGA